MNLGERIKKERERLDISRKEMAQKLSLSYQTLAKYENGEREPDYATLRSIAEYLRVSADYLLDVHTTSDLRFLGADERQLIRGYRTLTLEAKERIQNQVSFECMQQSQKNAPRRSALC